MFDLLAAAAVAPWLGNLDWPKLIECGQRLSETVAIIVGGLWTYHAYVKGRVYSHRLEPRVSGEIRCIEGINYIMGSMELSNVGASKVPIMTSSALEVFGDRAYQLPKSDADRLAFESVPWDDRPTAFGVFRSHEWIEPGETIQEEKIIAAVIGTNVLLKLELTIDTGRTTASAMTIVSLKSNCEENVS
jgi:hypothetical protein